MADAIRLAAKGKTITLLVDVEQNTQLAINKDITLDLNGKTIKNTEDIWSDNANAILSITNGVKVTITGNGTIDAKESDCYAINVVNCEKSCLPHLQDALELRACQSAVDRCGVRVDNSRRHGSAWLWHCTRQN